MNSYDAIGGYFELETGRKVFAPEGAVNLNSARNCLAYILRAGGVAHVHIPRYLCGVALEPLKKMGVAYDFYDVAENLEIADDITLMDDSDALLVVNYFGVMDEYTASMAEKYGRQAILDCSQAFYFSPVLPSPTFYSPRKFFGVPDGGILYTETRLEEDLAEDVSYARFTHLVKRIDLGSEAAYADFKRDDASLDGQPVKAMSKLTRRLLGSVDMEAPRLQRLRNFMYLHERLRATNLLNVAAIAKGPLCYPYYSRDANLRDRLVSEKVFAPIYWSNVMEWCKSTDVEYQLAKNIVPLPIDQRYDEQHMQKIVEVVRRR